MTENKQNTRGIENQPGFFINRHYLTDLSFENPRGPVIAEECDKITKQLQAEVQIKEDKEIDTIVLTLTLEASYKGRAAFVCEISYCAQVQMKNIPDQLKSQILNVSVPTSLIPFLNNAIDHAAKAAGYPGINISTIDFAEIYADKMKRQPSH
jgi:protein-export chaperone SecB